MVTRLEGLATMALNELDAVRAAHLPGSLYQRVPQGVVAPITGIHEVTEDPLPLGNFCGWTDRDR